MSKDKNKSLDWVTKCAQSGGLQVLLQGDQKILAEKFNKVLSEFRKKEEEFNLATKLFRLEIDEFWLAIKKYMHATGVEHALDYDLGLDDDALKEGHFVVNLTKPAPKNRFPM